MINRMLIISKNTLLYHSLVLIFLSFSFIQIYKIEKRLYIKSVKSFILIYYI